MSVNTFSNRYAADCRIFQGPGPAKPPAGSRSILMRGFQDPHQVLGVEPGADDKKVKKAYKKLALKFHPDVSKDELAEAKFRGLREAYELLMGKGDPDRESRAPFGGNWEFHDWYWSFSMRQRQRRQNPDAAPRHSAAAAQKHKPNVMSQLHGLKARAAQRSTRASGPEPFVHEDAAPSAVPDVTVEAPAAATHFSPGSPVSHPVAAPGEAQSHETLSSDDEDTVTVTVGSWRGLLQAVEAHMSRHEALEAALSRHHVAVSHCKGHFEALQQWAQSRWGLRGGSTGPVGTERHTGPSSRVHVPFQHLGGRPSSSQRHAYAAIPRSLTSAARQDATGGEEHTGEAAEQSQVSVLVAEPAAEERQDSRKNAQEQAAGGRPCGGGFQLSEEGRSALNVQLAGLRRKAKLQERA